MGCEAELRSPFDNDFDLFSFCAIAGEFARPVKYRKAAIGVAIHTDPDFDVLAAMLIGRDLQDQTFERNAVALPTVRSSCSYRMSSRLVPIHGTKADPVSIAGCANSLLKRGI